MTEPIELVAGYYGGLVCPNPLEQFQMTRSYESMRQEFDLLNCHRFTNDEVMQLMAIQDGRLPLWLLCWPLYLLALEVLLILLVARR